MSLAERVYKDYEAAGKEVGHFPLPRNLRVLEIGFGSGKLLEALRDNGNDVHGVDVSESLTESARSKGFENVHCLDVSEESLPFPDDYFHAIYCYEVFEHLTNPHRLFYEVRRVLKEDLCFFLSVPAQEVDMGYGAGLHTFVYPGLLEKENLCRFIMQMYFRIDKLIEPRKHDYFLGYNFALRNMKRPGTPDVVEVVAKDNNVQGLYGHFLTQEELGKEVAREVEAQLERIAVYLGADLPDVANARIAYLLQTFPDYIMLYPSITCLLLELGQPQGAEEFVDIHCRTRNLPQEVMKEIESLLETHGG